MLSSCTPVTSSRLSAVSLWAARVNMSRRDEDVRSKLRRVTSVAKLHLVKYMCRGVCCCGGGMHRHACIVMCSTHVSMMMMMMYGVYDEFTPPMHHATTYRGASQ